MSRDCQDCLETAEEMKKLEDKVDRFHDEYTKELTEYKVDKTVLGNSVTGLHRRLDEMKTDFKEANKNFSEHMKNEEKKYDETNKVLTEINNNLATINASIPHLASTKDLETANGRITTLWIIGSLVVTMVMTTVVYFVKEGFEHKIEESSKANYHGVKKIIEDNKKK